MKRPEWKFESSTAFYDVPLYIIKPDGEKYLVPGVSINVPKRADENPRYSPTGFYWEEGVDGEWTNNNTQMRNRYVQLRGNGDDR